MIAKCEKHGMIRIAKQRSTCPKCRSKLSRPNVSELSDFGDSIMYRMRATRAYIDATGNDDAMKLAAFMSIMHGIDLSESQATAIIKERKEHG